MRILNILLVVFLSATTMCSLHAQQVNPTFLGTAKGIVRDTAHNYVLRSATVSVYKNADSTLLSYQISNNYGEFNFKNLPVNTTLKLEVSHIGYQLLRKTFTIPGDKNFIDLKTLIISPRDITLKDVVISVPPISMNGDTLEFNAAAFKLDSNAVVEDLLRKIPNITLWGDGQITVNGREVKNILVNGKRFFGGDAKIATQNIAKSALDKIQVYSTVKDKSNPLDSTLEMNLKLKKGKDIGYFGKVGGGYGTHDHFEVDASFNVFSPKMQVAIVAARNNINKLAGDISTLVENSTFKGVGTNVEYQPDFRAPGINRPTAAGFTFNYNFIEKPTYNRNNSLSSSYLIQDKNSENLSQTTTTTTINSTDQIFEQNKNENSASNTNQKFNSEYEWTDKINSLRISQSLDLNRGDTKGLTLRNALNTENILTSTNNTVDQNNFNNSVFNVNAIYRLSQNYLKQKQLFKGLNASYSLSVTDNQTEKLNVTEFKSYVNSLTNQKFNRKYDTEVKGLNQNLNVELMDLKSMLFGDADLGGIDFRLTNALNLNSNNDRNDVQDLDTLTNKYGVNNYLSNKIQTNVLDEAPGIVFAKSFYKGLSNRFNQSLTFNFSPKQKFIYQNNRSDRSFQNIKRKYSRFLPDASVTFNDHQYGEYYRNYSLNYKTTVLIPTIQQLAPLTDSTNLYYLQRGNVNLRAGIEQALSFSFNHYDQTNKNTLNYNFYINAGMIDNNVVDSILIDDQNRRTVYLVNADGNKYINFRGDLRKAFKFKTSELQVGVNGYFSSTKNPGYTNSIFTFSRNTNASSELNLNYTYKSYLAIAASQSYTTYKSKQEAFNTEYTGKTLASSFSTSCNVTKKLTLSSNVSFNSNSSAGAKDVNFTIWNASAVYRILKGNNAEFKFSALDLLRQNNNVINYGTANSFTVGTQNVLRQYFMTTLSYYPREFGKKKAKK